MLQNKIYAVDNKDKINQSNVGERGGVNCIEFILKIFLQKI